MILKASDQARVYHVLTALADQNPDLPAAEIHVRGHISLGAMLTVTVALHGEPEAFEQWRQALNIPPVKPEQMQLGGWVSRGFSRIGDIQVELVLHHRQEAPPARVLAAVA